MKNKPLVIGHRGASGLVQFENSFEAFQKAIDIGCDGIECDVRKTSDDILVINHNPNIGDLIIKDHTYEELNNYTTNLGYTLPTLIETLKLVKDKILIDIELKEVGYEEKIVNEILSILPTNKFFVRSFFDEALIKIHKLNKDIRIILLTGLEHPKHLLRTRYSEVYPKRRLKRCGAYAVSPYYKEMVMNYSKRLTRQGYPIITWTVNTEEDMRNCIGKVDGIITNHPDKLMNIIDDIYNKKEN